MDITVRRFCMDDVSALIPLRVAVEKADRLDLVVAEDELRRILARPSLSPEQNSFVARTHDGQMVGEAWLEVRHGVGETLFILAGHVHPAWRRRGIGRQLLSAILARAKERLGEAAGRRAWLQSRDVHDEDAGRAALFERAGFHVARWALDMRRELPGIGQVAPIIPLVQEPSGIQLRKWRAGVDDEAIGWLFDEAFHDHWGYAQIEIESWLQQVRGGFINVEHSVLAWDAANDRLVGACANLCDERTFERRGRRELYVEVMGVRREYRKRGAATAMLTWTLHRAHHLGMQSVGLDADAENLSGAVQLYKRLGFETIGKMRVYRKELSGD